MKVQSRVSCWCGIELDYKKEFSDIGVDYPIQFTRGYENIVVLGDKEVFYVDQVSNPIKIAWLAGEPREREPRAYKFVEDNLDKFNLVFTFDKRLLELTPKARLCPFGTTRFSNFRERQITKKTKNLSIIGNVRMFDLEGHRLRDQVVGVYRHKFDGIKHGGDFCDKHLYLDDYRFSVVIENTKSDFYFSEKLMDCLKVGTIPVYWGCPSIIEKFGFDPKGLITFNDIQELGGILDHLDENYYNQNMAAVSYNHKKADEYLQCCHPKFLWDNGIKDL
jgi:hypothetical protein